MPADKPGKSWRPNLVLFLGILFLIYPIVVAHAIFAVWPAVEEVSAAGDMAAVAEVANGDETDEGLEPATAEGGEDSSSTWPTQEVTIFGYTMNVTAGQAYYLLMAIFGIAGAYVATATSFATYVGMGRFRSSWGWWYALRPFIGAGVAVILMIAILGGLVAVSSDSSALSPQNLNPYAVAAFSALAGWFSKTTSDKLEEVFQTILANSKDDERTNKLTKSDGRGSKRVEIISPDSPASVAVNTELEIAIKPAEGLKSEEITDLADIAVADTTARLEDMGEGRFAFTGLEVGSYRVPFSASELEPALLQVNVTPEQKPDEVVVVAVGDVEAPAAGEAVVGAVNETVVIDVEAKLDLALAEVRDGEGNVREDVKVERSPGDDPQFFVTAAEPGSVVLEFTAPGAAPAEVKLDVRPKGKFSEIYIVRAGDVLSRIAKEFDLTLDKLLAGNPQIDNPDRINVGDRINVPLQGEAGSLQPIITPDIEDEDDTPVWMAIAGRELETGVKEVKGGRHNPRIIEYHKATSLADTGSGGRDETPWCSSFVNFCVQQAGLRGTRSARARSWLRWKEGTKLTEPQRGCIVVFERPPNPKHGHVAFFLEETGKSIIVLGGNQGDQVSEKAYPKKRVIGYFWPKQAPATPIPEPADFSSAKDWSRFDDDVRCRHVMNLLTDRYGYPVNGAAGIVGNLMAESGVIPNRIEGSRKATPMRAKDISGRLKTWTAEEIMNRIPRTRGPKRPGVGLAQWTSKNRRRGLFEHAFDGTTLGAGIVFDMEAQVDYLVDELASNYRSVDRLLRDPGVTVDAAADEVVYRYEVPGSVLGRASGKTVRLKRDHPDVVRVFSQRRKRAQAALQSVAG